MLVIEVSGKYNICELCIIVIVKTVYSRHNSVNILQDTHKRPPIAHPRGWAMGCLLWVQSPIYFLHLSCPCLMQYHVISHHVITIYLCLNHHIPRLKCNTSMSEHKNPAAIPGIDHPPLYSVAPYINEKVARKWGADKIGTSNFLS